MLVLASALPAHAGDGVASPDAGHAVSRSPFAATFVQRPEASALGLPRIRQGNPALANERGGSPHDARGTGSWEAGRARPKLKLAVGRPKSASSTASGGSLQPRTGWVGVALQF
jgi:hypothetical protein